MRFLTTAEAEQIYGIPAETFAEWCRDGKLVSVRRKGRKWILPEESIENYLNSNPALRPPSPHSALPSPAQSSINDNGKWRWIERVRDWKEKSPIAFLLAILAALLLGFTGIFGSVGDWQEDIKVYFWPPSPTPLAFATAAPDQTLILIMRFHSTAATDTEPHSKIRRRIEEELKQLNEDKIRVAVEPTILTADDREQAVALGKRYNASMVVWGEDTGIEILVNFLHLRPLNRNAAELSIIEREKTQLANPPAYTQFILTELPNQIAFLSLTAIGESYTINQDYSHAARVIESAVHGLPTGTTLTGLANAYFMLGWLYQTPALRDLSSAITNYNKSIELDPNNDLAFSNRGLALDMIGEHSQAIQDHTQAIALVPNVPQYYFNRGLAYKHIGKLELAIEDYSQAITLNPNYAEAYNNRGLAYFELEGGLELAIEDFTQALTLNPNYAEAYNNRCLAFDKKGDQPQAIQECTNAIALDPHYAEAYVDRGIAYGHKGEQELAIQDYTTAIDLDPGLAPAYVNRGNVYKENGKQELAIQDYTKAISLEPNDFVAYYGRGLAYVDQGKQDLAILDFTTAITLNPNDAELYFVRGTTYSERVRTPLEQSNVESALQDLGAAINDYNYAIALKPDYAEVYFHRGLVAVIYNDFPQAIKDLEFFISWSREHNQYASARQQAEEMVLQLKDGKNPLAK